MSWYSKKQLIVVLLLTITEYIVLTLAAKEATWLRLLLTELELLQLDQPHAFIKVYKYNTSAHAIHNNFNIVHRGRERKIIILLKSDN